MAIVDLFVILANVLSGLVFVISSGLLFHRRHRENRYLIAVAGLIAVVSTFYLVLQVRQDVVSRDWASLVHWMSELGHGSGDGSRDATTAAPQTDTPVQPQPTSQTASAANGPQPPNDTTAVAPKDTSPAPAAAAAPVVAPIPSMPDDAGTVRTIVNSSHALALLKANKGIALQWISWDYLGTLKVTDTDGIVRLSGRQASPDGKQVLTLEGTVRQIDDKIFYFDGEVTYSGTPEVSEPCVRKGELTFKITSGRKYWRMQQMEAGCGKGQYIGDQWYPGHDLTDYVDIFF